MLIFAIVVILGALLWYALAGRAWLKSKAWANPFFDFVEPVEIALFKKSETMLVGRILSFGGMLVTFYDSIAVFATSLDWTPVTSRILADVPPDMRGMVISSSVFGLGLLIGWLRKRTSKPLEVVALPADVPPLVAAAVNKAEATNAQAVRVIEADSRKGDA